MDTEEMEMDRKDAVKKLIEARKIAFRLEGVISWLDENIKRLKEAKDES